MQDLRGRSLSDQKWGLAWSRYAQACTWCSTDTQASADLKTDSPASGPECTEGAFFPRASPNRNEQYAEEEALGSDAEGTTIFGPPYLDTLNLPSTLNLFGAKVPHYISGSAQGPLQEDGRVPGLTRFWVSRHWAGLT